jgi:protein SCO1/2
MVRRSLAGSLAAALCICVAWPAAAALTRQALKDVGFHLVPGAPMPATAALRGLDGRDTTLGRALDGKPALLVFTDYRCESLCGIVLDQLAETLPKARLRLGTDYNVISVALDPTQTAADATRFRDQHTTGSPLRDLGLFFTDDAPALAALRDSVGLVAPFDAEHKQFAHPAGLVVIDAAGKARRVLSPFALDPLDLRLALTDGGAEPSSFVAHALLLCYGWNPVAGVYTLRIERVMAIAAALTIVLIGLGVGLLLYHERRVPHSS